TMLLCHFTSSRLLAQNVCVENGTLLFIETFDSYNDGLNSSSPIYATTPLSSGMTTYTFVKQYPSPGLIDPGVYALYKGGGTGWPVTKFHDDHTYPNDITKGRMLATNGKSTPDLVYKQDITDLCSGTELYFSFWMRGDNGLVYWKIYSGTSSTLLATFGPISNPGNTAWKFYGYDFTLPAGETSIRFEIWNDDTSFGGNDLAYDDIAVHLCTNKVNVTANGSSNTNVFINRNNKNVNFEGSYVNDAKFGTTLTSYWLYSTTGDITSLTDWTVVDTKSPASYHNSSTLNHNVSLATSEPGYYRLVIGNGSSILTNKCRAASDVFHVQELPDNIITDGSECLVEFKKIDFGIKQKWSSASNTAHYMAGALVGDLDNDGIAEVVTYNPD
ncbi:hypothetical protein MRX50_19165, partial [Fusibacter sp. A2]|uniref:hypothetical protein n=1 Tax=Fusibacter sp. A2 TaxID=2929473 RepID=UPI0020BE582F